MKMKRSTLRKQDLSCLFLYYFGYSNIRNALLRLRRTPVSRVLAFHDISADLVPRFKEQIKYLKEKTNVVGLDDILAGRLRWKKINIAITFDDGFQGWYDNAFPILRHFGLPATFFVSSGFVGLDKEKERDFIRNKLMDEIMTTGSIRIDSLKRLADDGFGVGGHTSNHVNLNMLSDINDLQEEIELDKNLLEKLTEVKIDYFAYPFGLHRNVQFDLDHALRCAGYRGAVTTDPGFNTASTNSYLLHRDLVSATMPMPVFKARLHGNYDGVLVIRRILGL